MKKSTRLLHKDGLSTSINLLHGIAQSLQTVETKIVLIYHKCFTRYVAIKNYFIRIKILIQSIFVG